MEQKFDEDCRKDIISALGEWEYLTENGFHKVSLADTQLLPTPWRPNTGIEFKAERASSTGATLEERVAVYFFSDYFVARRTFSGLTPEDYENWHRTVKPGEESWKSIEGVVKLHIRAVLVEGHE
jgi:hypothetical protein